MARSRFLHMFGVALGLMLLLFVGSARAATTNAPFLRIEGQQLVLDKRFLGRSLVFLPGQIESSRPAIPAFSSASVPIVHFQRGNGVVYLVEEPRATAWLHSSVTTQHLATFPLLRETATALAFDFHSGALHDFFRSPLSQQTATDTNAMLLATPTPALDGAYFRSHAAGPGWFTMEHVVGNAGAVFRYTFWLADHSTLTPLRDDRDDAIGLFPPQAWLGMQRTPPIVWRVHPERPFTFHLSANMPQHVRAAVRDGALAWNTIFHRDVIHVADAPASLAPGDPRYPMIYWSELPHRNAIAQMQAHPLTGEILNAVIVVQAGWAEVTPVDFTEIPATPSAFRFAPTTALCDYRAMSPHAAMYGTAFDDATLQHLGLLQLRAVVMHEVGHVLGLRHNFAGNLGTEIPPDADAADFAQLVEGTRPADTPLPSSSIMDYLPLADDVRMTHPGRYDAAAIAAAYPEFQLDTPRDADSVRFCTDEQVGAIADCARRDGGAEPIAWWAGVVESGIEAYNQWIIDNVIIPADQFDRFQPDEQLRTELAEGRIGEGLRALQRYAEGRHTWVLHGHYPFERATQARATLARLGLGLFPNRHPAVREDLAAQLATLETAAPSDTPHGRWAQQVLINIQAALDALPLGAREVTATRHPPQPDRL